MRPVHLQPRYVGLVFIGGAVGTGIREGLALAFPVPAAGFPVTVFVINVVGAFALGVLLETVTRRGPDTGPRRILRLLIGTGVLGGFTTYSSFATDVALLLPHATGVALVYAGLSLIIGLVAALAGIAAAQALQHQPGADS